LLEEAEHLGFELAITAGEFGGLKHPWVVEQGQFWANNLMVSAGVEQGDLETGWGKAITMRAGDSFNDSVQPQAAQIVAHPAPAELFRLQAQELRK